MNTNKYGLEVLVSGTSGKKNIAKLSHNGKLFIEAKDGTEYSLRVSNSTGKRVMAIITVDGVNVVDGTKDEKGTGYIVNAYSAVEIKGFRESTTHVGNFKFAVKGKGYNSDKASGGSVTNSGVIGCIFIEEKEDAMQKAIEELSKRLSEQKKEEHHHHHWHTDYHYPPYNTPIIYGGGGTYTSAGNSDLLRSFSGSQNVQNYNYSCYAGDVGPQGSQEAQASTHAPGDVVRGTKSAKTTLDWMEVDQERSAGQSRRLNLVADTKAPDFDLATAWGQRTYDKVEMVEFERGAILEQITIYYASREVLEEAGVPVVQKKAVSFPEPFPGRFCTPPKNY